MGFSTSTSDLLIYGLGLTFIITSITVLILNKRQRDAVFDRLHFRSRRTSGANTPPRSLSPDKKSAYVSPSSGPNYVDALPPSRRFTLNEIASKYSGSEKKLFAAANPDAKIAQDLLPIEQSYLIETKTPKYTPTGFSTAEVRALGDFPDYEILSGVTLPQAYKEHNLENARPRPYRPLRWTYHQTMSFHKMENDWWLEVENTYVSRINERKALFAEYGNKVLDYLPGSELCCKELMEMTLTFYCHRFPQYFSLSEDKKIFCNQILKTETELKRFHPLHVILNNIPEDFAIVLRNDKDGFYEFRAGVICSSLGWNVGTKIGLQMQGIHIPTVPDYKEKMSFSMDRFFSKMHTNQPIQRGSWGLEVGTPLFMPPGHPHEKLREIQDPNLKIEDVNFRVDWQTLRRLPLSGAIVFNFKALFTPVTEFRDEPYVPALCSKILKEGKANLMQYKGTWHVQHVTVPHFDAWAKEQVEKGLVKTEDGKPWVEETLAEQPYFPGWSEKWHRQQGF